MTGLRQIWYRFTLSLLRINSTEAASRIGRNFTKKAELPAVPAASKKGASGKQQLEANTTPPSAARLARIVRVERWRFAPCSFLFIVIALTSLLDSAVLLLSPPRSPDPIVAH